MDDNDQCFDNPDKRLDNPDKHFDNPDKRFDNPDHYFDIWDHLVDHPKDIPDNLSKSVVHLDPTHGTSCDPDDHPGIC